jgi:uncharacterized protein YbbK (DUF523 family)
MTAEADAPLRLGVSACLLGEAVRFDGGHKRDFFLVKTLGRFVEWVPVCPELESGLGVPRESMRLVQMHREIRLVTGKTANDHTDTVGRYTARRLEEIAEQGLCGFVLKKDSPTCGLERVRVYNASGVPTRDGRGPCRGAGRALSHASGRRRGAVSRPAAPRKFHRMHPRVS